MSSVNNLFNIYHRNTVIVLSVKSYDQRFSYEINVKDVMTLLNYAESYLFFSHKKKRKYRSHTHYYI